MKTPSFLEFQTLVQYFSDELEGAQLQEVQATADGLVLGFYRFQKTPRALWLVIDLDIQFPFLGLYDSNPWARLKKPKPVSLFINSHFKNQYIQRFEYLEKWGRVAKIVFTGDDQRREIEIRLIPKQPNVIVSCGKKNVAWDKPKELIAIGEQDSNYTEVENRSVHFMMKQWFDRRANSKIVNENKEKSGVSPYDRWLAQKKKDLDKKTKAFQQIDAQIAEFKGQPWAAIGEYLKIHGFKNLPLEWTHFVDLGKKSSWNIEHCFEKSKQIANKILGAEKRKLVLTSEIQALSDLSEEKFQKSLTGKEIHREKNPQRKKTEGQFRKLSLDESKGLVCMMGKSASENLKLLRQAKSWDLWVHLKDYPSAYAILQKGKDQKVSDAIVIQAAQWLVKESTKQKKQLEGVKLAVVVVECRHVRPIKGDKLGRVTYHHPRELLITV